jgi:hypothetical protein
MKPNCSRGFTICALFFFSLIVVVSGVIPSLQGKRIQWAEVFVPALMGSVFMGVFICVIFTPQEIGWDEEKISLRVIFPKSGVYTWSQLEAYSTWGGRFAAFLLKLQGVQSYQIVPVCFRAAEWKKFQFFLRTRFPEKKTWVWLGPVPVRFGKK